jgi:hypothetical protein
MEPLDQGQNPVMFLFVIQQASCHCFQRDPVLWSRYRTAGSFFSGFSMRNNVGGLFLQPKKILYNK